MPYRDYIGSHARGPGRRRPATGRSCTAPSDPFEAPNWTRDGKALIYNTSGRVEGRGRSTASTSRRASRRSSTPAPRTATTTTTCSRSTAPCSASATRAPGHDGVDDLHGARRRAARRSASRRSRRRTCTAGRPTAKSLVYTGRREQRVRHLPIASDGSGTEVNLTTSKGLDDGPEFTPDGQCIYFNSARSGPMQIWRMQPDGSNRSRSRTTSSTTGSRTSRPTASRSRSSATRGHRAADHPYYKRVYLRLMPLGGGRRRLSRTSTAGRARSTCRRGRPTGSRSRWRITGTY